MSYHNYRNSSCRNNRVLLAMLVFIGITVVIAKNLVDLAQLVGRKDWDKPRKDALIFKIKDEMVKQCVAKIHDIDHDFELIIGKPLDLTIESEQKD